MKVAAAVIDDDPPDQPTERDEAHQALYEAVDLLEAGKHWSAIRDALDVLHAGDDHLKLLVFCICLTSGLKEKGHFWAVGRSQMGKSRLETKTAELFPNVEVYDTQSPLFLLYQVKDEGPEYLKGKIVVIEEVLDHPAVWGLIKRLTSADKDHVTHGTVVNGRPLKLEIVGLPVVLSNSVETSVDEQINNRFFIGNVDESAAQDERVRDFQVEEAEGLARAERERKVALGRAIVQQILSERDVEVLLPAARFIDFPMTAERVNRKKFYRLVKVVAYANRYRRRRLGKGRDEGPLVATEEDARFAYGLWLGVQAYQQTQLDETGTKILREVPADAYEPLPSILERLESKAVNPSTARKRLKRLYEQNLVDERRTKEVDFDEGTGYQKVVPGWTLEYKRTVGDLEWFSTFPRGLEGGLENPSSLPSPLQGEESVREIYYRRWAVSLVDRGDFHISTISTNPYKKEDVKAWAAEMAATILGREA
ncbi:MAG: hypothetical protein V3U30_04985 [Thermoplasmata archaeon]